MKDAYVAGMPTARRRRRRAVLLAGLGLLALALVGGGWQLLRPGDEPPRASVARETSACLEPPAGIVVDVYNATARAGLAGHTADTLRAQRFEVGVATNAPDGETPEGPAEIRHGPRSAAGAALLARRIRGATLREITRADTHVDLLIGPDFDAVTAPTEAPSC